MCVKLKERPQPFAGLRPDPCHKRRHRTFEATDLSDQVPSLSCCQPPKAPEVCTTRQRDQEATLDSEGKGCGEAPRGRTYRAGAYGTRRGLASRPAREATVSLGIGPPCPEAEQGRGNRDKWPLPLSHTEVLLLSALKGVGRAGTEARSTQSWLRVQHNHPTLGPTRPLGVREGESVTAAVMDTGQGQPETCGQQQQEGPGAGEGGWQWHRAVGAAGEGRPHRDWALMRGLPSPGRCFQEAWGHRGTQSGFLAPRQPRPGRASLLCAPHALVPCHTRLFTVFSRTGAVFTHLCAPSTCRPGCGSLNEWMNYCYDKSTRPPAAVTRGWGAAVL